MDSFDQIADKIGELCPELKGDILKSRENLARLKQEREDLVKKCHPDGKCWPLHPDCPACQKIIQKYVMKTLKPNIEISDANTLMHSLATVLNEQSREKFYTKMQEVRDTDDPKEIAQAVLCNMVILTLEKIKCEESSKSS